MLLSLNSTLESLLRIYIVGGKSLEMIFEFLLEQTKTKRAPNLGKVYVKCRVRTLFGTKNSRTFQGHSRAQFQFSSSLD